MLEIKRTQPEVRASVSSVVSQVTLESVTHFMNEAKYMEIPDSAHFVIEQPDDGFTGKKLLLWWYDGGGIRE